MHSFRSLTSGQELDQIWVLQKLYAHLKENLAVELSYPFESIHKQVFVLRCPIVASASLTHWNPNETLRHMHPGLCVSISQSIIILRRHIWNSYIIYRYIYTYIYSILAISNFLRQTIANKIWRLIKKMNNLISKKNQNYFEPNTIQLVIELIMIIIL